MTGAELYRRVRRLRVNVLRRVRTRLAGSYASAFRGPGIEFEDFAAYEPGDDVRHIAWQVTARRGRPHVKRYREERELRLLIAMDVSASMDAAARGPTARERACEVAAALALSAAGSGDRVGGLMFADRMLRAIPARRGEKHALNVLRQALGTESPGPVTDLRPLLRQLCNLRGHAVVVLLSDFLCDPPPWTPELHGPLGACGDKHDVIAVRLLTTPLEAPPGGAAVRVVDPESGKVGWLDLSGPSAAGAWASAWREQRSRAARAFRAAGVPLLELLPEDDQLTCLNRFLKATRTGRRAR